MAVLQALDPGHHSSLLVDQQKAQEQGADLHMVPVVLSEFQRLVVSYPILFSKSAETGQFVCVALMGLEAGENLFWQPEGFSTVYLPANIARYPFFAGQDAVSGDNKVMCIDVESDAVVSGEGTRIFDKDGQATEYLNEIQDTLAELLVGEAPTAAFVSALQHSELLVPLRLEITFENGRKSSVRGLYSVDEDKLGQLCGEQLKTLQQNGYLQAIYTQLASMGQIYALIDRKNQRDAQPSPWFQSSDV